MFDIGEVYKKPKNTSYTAEFIFGKKDKNDKYPSIKVTVDVCGECNYDETITELLSKFAEKLRDELSSI